jgi:hypothetical protein
MVMDAHRSSDLLLIQPRPLRFPLQLVRTARRFGNKDSKFASILADPKGLDVVYKAASGSFEQGRKGSHEALGNVDARGILSRSC